MTAIKGLVISLFLVSFAADGFAGPFDFSGDWDLSMNVSLAKGDAEGPGVCAYQGSASVTQDGAAVSGTASYDLVEGEPICPAKLSAAVTGTVDEFELTMGLLMGPLGSATFNGYLSLPAGDGLVGLGGDFLVTSGPFSGTDGFWGGTRGSIPDVDIPALGTLGLVALGALLLGAGLYALKR